MKTSYIKLKVIALATATLFSQVTLAKDYTPEVLLTVLDRVEELSNESTQAIVLFDLDDTLINTRERNLRILRDFAAQESVQTQFAEAAQKISSLAQSQIRYLLPDTLKGIGIEDADLVKQASDFWLARFFTNEYCAKDKANPGAAKYLQILGRAGAKIVYLTGRDTPRMGSGTQENLIRNRFPMGPDQAVLLMKPDAKIDDLQFKKDSFAKIAEMGEVVGVFENEPANVNAMADAFPDAEAIFLDTIHSPKPDVPQERVQWVQNFKLR